MEPHNDQPSNFQLPLLSVGSEVPVSLDLLGAFL